MLKKRINKYWSRLLTWLAGNLPIEAYEVLIARLITTRMERLEPREAIRFVLRLDAAQYPLQSQAAIRYNQGSHPKHRLTQYHDFFVGLVKKGERVLDIGCGQGDVDYDPPAGPARPPPRSASWDANSAFAPWQCSRRLGLCRLRWPRR